MVCQNLNFRWHNGQFWQTASSMCGSILHRVFPRFRGWLELYLVRALSFFRTLFGPVMSRACRILHSHDQSCRIHTRLAARWKTQEWIQTNESKQIECDINATHSNTLETILFMLENYDVLALFSQDKAVENLKRSNATRQFLLALDLLWHWLRLKHSVPIATFQHRHTLSYKAETNGNLVNW